MAGRQLRGKMGWEGAQLRIVAVAVALAVVVGEHNSGSLGRCNLSRGTRACPTDDTPTIQFIGRQLKATKGQVSNDSYTNVCHIYGNKVNRNRSQHLHDVPGSKAFRSMEVPLQPITTVAVRDCGSAGLNRGLLVQAGPTYSSAPSYQLLPLLFPTLDYASPCFCDQQWSQPDSGAESARSKLGIWL